MSIGKVMIVQLIAGYIKKTLMKFSHIKMSQYFAEP